MKIPFNRPYVTGREVDYIRQAVANHHLSGDGPFTAKCHSALESMTGCKKALLTQSCTAALEMAALLVGLEPGDEVIMPSFTFVSTANAFVLRGAVPVFVDIRPDTLNIDESRIEPAITPRTKAIVVVHYAGVSCEMGPILEIANRNGLVVIEDAAQGLLSTYRGRSVGSFGHLATLSFHETKNVISGEGGALLINAPDLVSRAEIIREKGTNRSQFFRGQVDKYTWVDVGSSFLPSELTAAFLYAQIEEATAITERRRALWNRYHAALASAASAGRLRQPVVPGHCSQNAHLYYVLVRDLNQRTRMLERLNAAGVNAVFHYVPLHSSPAGRRYARVSGDLSTTDNTSERLIRLPLWVGMDAEVDAVAQAVTSALEAVR